MLAKRRRIPRELFSELLVRSEYRNSPLFTLRFKRGGESARIGVSVSKKVSKKAVIRNRTRRRVYALVSGYIDQLPSGAYLFVAKSGSERLKGESLSSELTLLLTSVLN